MDNPVDDGPAGAGTDDLARAALARAQGMSRTLSGGDPVRGNGVRGRRRVGEGSRRDRRDRRDSPTGRNKGGYSGPGPDPDSDPQLVGPLLAGYIEERGWDRPLAEARVFAQWQQLVGADVAAHCVPQSLTAGELRIAAESTAWATQLRLLAGTLLARVVAELGPDTVTKLVITGPVAPSWKHGGRSVRGARGPRDTYG